MMIQINFETKDISNFSTDVLAAEKKRLERKIANMEQMNSNDMQNYTIIKAELEKRSE